MKAKKLVPIDKVKGTIAAGYYARVVYGKQIIQRCPVRKKKPTEKQLAARKWFAEKIRKKKIKNKCSQT